MRAVRVVSVLLLGFALSGCTAAATTTTSTLRSQGPVVAVEAGSDVGNDRPHVTFDGLMVRRRVVIAIRPKAGADLDFLRRKMDDAAGRLHMTLSTVSTSVLDPVILEHLAPELTVALPAGKSLADARRLIDPASVEGRRFGEVAKYDVASVLVHDLRFTAASANPVFAANDIDKEGILTDALGNYTTVLRKRELEITYTGPLLSDDLVESVRVGIARGADIQPAAVIVSPRSSAGVGVDMAKEPAPARVVIETVATHHHADALPAVSTSSSPSTWAVSVVAFVSLLILALALFMIRRLTRGTQKRVVETHQA